MTAKEYLLQVQELTERIDMQEAEIRRIQTTISGIGKDPVRSSWPDGQPHGTGTTDPTAMQAILDAEMYSALQKELKQKLLDAKIILLRKKADLCAKRMDIVETIGKINAGQHTAACIKILRMRYLDNCGWEKISADVGYTVRHVQNLHGLALIAVEKKLQEK